MTMHMRLSLTAIVTLLMAGLPVGWAGEPNESTVSLEFEVRNTALGPLDVSSVRRRGGPDEEVFAARKPAYAVGIPFEMPTSYLARPGSGYMRGFLRSVLGETLGTARADTHGRLSAAQKEFLQATQGLLDAERPGGPVPQWYHPQDEPNRPRQLLLYAMTLEDAKAMAEAYNAFVMENWRSDAEDRRRRVEEKTRELVASEKRTDELVSLIESSEQALNALKPKIPYRTEKEAMEAIAELDRMLNAAQVDIAGIQSKIRAIQEHLRTHKSPYDNAIEAKLQGMFVEESVALQGAAARKTMATQLRADASRFLDLRETIVNGNRDRANLRARMVKLTPEIETERARLESLMSDMPEIAGDAIPIYPVEWVAESQDDQMGPKGP